MNNINLLRRQVFEEKISMCTMVFNLFDEDKNGLIDYQELKSALKAFGFPSKKEEVLKILDVYDRKSRKFLGCDDFKTVVIDKIMRCDPLEEMKYAFKLMCGNNDSISVRELSEALELIGVEIKEDEVRKLINEFDQDGNASIDEEEFINIMLLDKKDNDTL